MEEVKSLRSTVEQMKEVFVANRNEGSDKDKEELISLRSTVEKLKDGIFGLSANVKQVIKNIVGNDEEIPITFPLKTKEELEEIEKKAGEDPEKYNAIFKKIIVSSGGGVDKAMKNIISPEVALAYNFDGTNGKEPFKSLRNVNSCLFNAVKTDSPSTQVYKKAVQQGLKRIKNLHYKKNTAQKKNKDEIYMQTSSF